MSNASILSVYNSPYDKRAAKVLRNAKAKAVKFCGAGNSFIPISNISKSTRDAWCNGEIELIGNGNDLGVIYHEVFHSVYHESPIWQIDEMNSDPIWGNAFCDAFRYLMQKKYKDMGVRDKDFVTKFKKCLKMNDADITAQHSYKELGSRIIIYLGPSASLNRYRSLWKLLNKKASNTGFNLYEFFGLNHITP